MNARYFDNAATTPVHPSVLEAMLPYFSEQPGNAHSIHAWGIRARAAVEDARRSLAQLIGAEDPSQIVFTSGATEGNNWVLKAFGHGWVTPFEHSSVREPAEALAFGLVPFKGYNLFPVASGAGLVSAMAVNNEVGTIFEPASLRGIAQAVHCDATQAVGKLPLKVGELDYLTASAHKFYGPKGVGILYAREPGSLEPLLRGGEQEGGLRSGTLNVAGIVGAGMAARIAVDEIAANAELAATLKEIVLDQLQRVGDWRVNGGERVTPYILSLSFLGIEGETLVLEADAHGFAIGSGAACSSRKAEPSHVLTAIGVPTEWLRGTVRISFGRTNTAESAAELGQLLARTVERLRKLRKSAQVAT